MKHTHTPSYTEQKKSEIWSLYHGLDHEPRRPSSLPLTDHHYHEIKRQSRHPHQLNQRFSTLWTQNEWRAKTKLLTNGRPAIRAIHLDNPHTSTLRKLGELLDDLKILLGDVRCIHLGVTLSPSSSSFPFALGAITLVALFRCSSQSLLVTQNNGGLCCGLVYYGKQNTLTENR